MSKRTRPSSTTSPILPPASAKPSASLTDSTPPAGQPAQQQAKAARLRIGNENQMAVTGLVDAFDLRQAHFVAIDLAPFKADQRTAKGITTQHVHRRSGEPIGRRAAGHST